MVPDGPARADGVAAVKVDADGVGEGQNGDEREDTRGHERDCRRLVAEVEQRGCDCADVDGELELSVCE